MSTLSTHELIESNLSYVLAEMKNQPEVAQFYSPNELSYKNTIAQISEFIDVAGEYGLAYEYIVWELEAAPFKISGKSAIKLLEVGLLMGFKSEQDRDKQFDRR